MQLNAEKGLPTYTLSSFINIGSSSLAIVKDIYIKKIETYGIEETLGKKITASLKIGFTIYEIQYNSPFPMNQMLFSRPIQSSEVFIVHIQQAFYRLDRRPVLS